MNENHYLQEKDIVPEMDVAAHLWANKRLCTDHLQQSLCLAEGIHTASTSDDCLENFNEDRRKVMFYFGLDTKWKHSSTWCGVDSPAGNLKYRTCLEVIARHENDLKMRKSLDAKASALRRTMIDKLANTTYDIQCEAFEDRTDCEPGRSHFWFYWCLVVAALLFLFYRYVWIPTLNEKRKIVAELFRRKRRNLLPNGLDLVRK